MHFAQLWQSVEVRLQAWRRRWWPPDARVERRAAADELEAEIEQAAAELGSASVVLEELRQRVGASERQAVRLTGQVAECVKAGYEGQAWPFVLELDELRVALEADRGELRRQEQLCWSQEFRLRQLRRLLERMRQEPASPAPRRS